MSGAHEDAVVRRRRVAGPAALGWWMHPAVADDGPGFRREPTISCTFSGPSGAEGGVYGSRPPARAVRVRAE